MPKAACEAVATHGDVTGEIAPPHWAHALTGAVVGRSRVRSAWASEPLIVEARAGADVTLISVTLSHDTSRESAEFQSVAAQMITVAFERLGASVHPRAVRVWCFLPGIYEPMSNGVDRYLNFNMARHAAYIGLFGEAAVRAGALPTSSCVGHSSPSMSVHVLGTVDGGVSVENPRQIPAFAYSARYGPRPPCFARATRCRIGPAQLLLVGGTASIRGEDSVHAGSRESQLQETLDNLKSLIHHAAGATATTHAACEVRAARVYLKHEADRRWLLESLPPEFSRHAPVEVLRADICRDELLVEIEMLVGLGAPGEPARPLSAAPSS